MAKQKESIGVIGLGRMGSAIATRLHGAGFQVAGWNRSARTLPDGVIGAHDLAALVDQSTILITSLYDDTAVQAVFDELARINLGGRLIVETSTISPETLRAAQPALQRAGAALIDAPISGGPEMVADGVAGMFIGGTDADFARFKPIAAHLSNRLGHIGPLGAGASAKMVNNMMLVGYWQVLKEALQTGKRAGLNLDTMLNIIAQGPAASGAFKGRMGVIRGEDNSVGFSTAGLVKDAKLFAGIGAALGVETPAIRASLASFEYAYANGLADTDFVRMLAQAYDMA